MIISYSPRLKFHTLNTNLSFFFFPQFHSLVKPVCKKESLLLFLTRALSVRGTVNFVCQGVDVSVSYLKF